MKAPANDPDLSIIALLFMLLLIYCSIRVTPESNTATDSSASVVTAAPESIIGSVKLLK